MSTFDQLFVYHPDLWQDRDWARLSGLPLEDVWFHAVDGTRLFGWYVESSDTPAVLLWCYGNAGNIINRLDNLRELYRLGFSVFLFDYRGYGRSQGRPSEEGLYQDALGAYAHVTGTRRIRPERNVLFGRSLGAAMETRFLQREVYFASAEADANYGQAYDERYRIGGGGTVGMLAHLTERWKGLLSGSYLRYALGEKSDDFRWFVGQRYTLRQNLAVRLEYNHRDHDNDVLFAVQAFF